MVYITSEGTLTEKKKRKWGLSIIRDLLVGLFDFVGLFFRTLTASPTALETERVSAVLLEILFRGWSKMCNSLPLRFASQIENTIQGQRRTTYAQRQGVRRSGGGPGAGSGGGANIRGVNRLGCAKAGAGG